MTDSKLYPVDPALAASAWVDERTYEAMYRQSIEDPDTFWAQQAKRLDGFSFRPKSRIPRSPLAILISGGMKTVF